MDKPTKIKTRVKFSALDLTAEVASIAKSLKDCKVNNIYDLDATTYIFKIGKGTFRGNLLIQSGVRLQLYDNFVEKNERPNGFTNKLRKHLRNLFMRSIEQIGAERVCKLTFTAGDESDRKLTFHIFVELYAKGNVVFTDADLKILALLRPHVYSETAKVAMGEVYPVEEAAKIFPEKLSLTPDQLAPEFLPAKPTYGSVAAKLVPCAHQTLTDVSLASGGLKPGDKFDAKQTPKLLEICANMLSLYMKNDFAKGYLYYQSGKETPFEVSPVPLNLVSSPGGALRSHSDRKSRGQF